MLPNRPPDYSKKTHKVFWEDTQDVKGARITFTGIPFMILGTKVYDYQHGVDRDLLKKKKRNQIDEVGLFPCSKKGPDFSKTLR